MRKPFPMMQDLRFKLINWLAGDDAIAINVMVPLDPTIGNRVTFMRNVKYLKKGQPCP